MEASRAHASIAEEAVAIGATGHHVPSKQVCVALPNKALIESVANVREHSHEYEDISYASYWNDRRCLRPGYVDPIRTDDPFEYIHTYASDLDSGFWCKNEESG